MSELAGLAFAIAATIIAWVIIILLMRNQREVADLRRENAAGLSADDLRSICENLAVIRAALDRGDRAWDGISGRLTRDIRNELSALLQSLEERVWLIYAMGYGVRALKDHADALRASNGRNGDLLMLYQLIDELHAAHKMLQRTQAAGVADDEEDDV